MSQLMARPIHVILAGDLQMTCFFNEGHYTLGCPTFLVIVTTRSTFLVGALKLYKHKPEFFATMSGKGDHPNYTIQLNDDSS